MLYLILGNNKDLIDKEIKKNSSSLPILKMDAFNFDPDLLRGEVESVSLFGGEDKAIVLNNISENNEYFEFLKNFLAILAESSKKIFFIENDLIKAEKEVFEEAKAEIFDLKEKKGGEFGYSPFALQDALGERNIKNMWVEFQRLKEVGIEGEDLIHKVISKVRDMVAISGGATKEDLNIKSDFPFNKSKRDIKNWKKAELEDFYTKIVSVYHNSRMGLEEIDLGLEKAILSL